MTACLVARTAQREGLAGPGRARWTAVGLAAERIEDAVAPKPFVDVYDTALAELPPLRSGSTRGSV